VDTRDWCMTIERDAFWIASVRRLWMSGEKKPSMAKTAGMGARDSREILEGHAAERGGELVVELDSGSIGNAAAVLLCIGDSGGGEQRGEPGAG